MQFYFILFLKIFRIEDHFSEKQKQSKHPTAEPWPAIFPNLKPCSSAMRMWTDLVLNLLTCLHLGWFWTQCLASGLYWLSLETSWWWLQFFTSSSCIRQPISWSPLWPARTFWWERPWCPSAWSGPWRAAGTLEPDLCPSQFLWCGILLLFSLPLVLHLHWQVRCCYWPPGLSHQVHGVCVRSMHQHLLDPAHCVQRSCVLHRCQWRWDGGISKCSQLYRRLSNCCKSRMGFDKCSDIFYTFPHYGNSLW